MSNTKLRLKTTLPIEHNNIHVGPNGNDKLTTYYNEY